MGDRVSIAFQNKEETSVTLFHHWGGIEFVDVANNYVADLKKWIAIKYEPHFSDPISRLEPNTVMVDFIRHITQGKERVNSSLYLGRDESEGDNSDNGHHIIPLG